MSWQELLFNMAKRQLKGDMLEVSQTLSNVEKVLTVSSKP